MTTTLQAYRRALSQELGRYAVFSTSAVATGFDAARQVISGYLRDDDEGSGSSMYDDGWVYVASNAADDQHRQVIRGGFRGDLGLLRLDRPFASALATPIVVEYHEHFPASTAEGVIGLNQLVGLALRDLWAPDALAVPTTGAESYVLPVWMDDPWYLDGLLDPPLATGLEPRPRDLPWGVRYEGATPRLWVRPPVATSFSMTALLRRPANTLINGAESTVGLVLDTDYALPPTSDVVAVGAMHAYLWLLAREDTPVNRSQAAAWEAAARALPHFNHRRHVSGGAGAAEPAAQEVAA